MAYKTRRDSLTNITFPVNEGVEYTFKKEPIIATRGNIVYLKNGEELEMGITAFPSDHVSNAYLDTRFPSDNINKVTITRKDADVQILYVEYTYKPIACGFYDDKSKVEVWDKDILYTKTVNFSGSTIPANGQVVVSSTITGAYSDLAAVLVGSVLINPHDYPLALIGCHVGRQGYEDEVRLYAGVQNLSSSPITIQSSSDLKVTAQLMKNY